MILLKELLLGSTDLTVAVFKIPQISEHFSAMLFEIINGSSDFRTFPSICSLISIFSLFEMSS